MAIAPIQNGESGLSVRQKLNALIGSVNDGTSAEYIDGKIKELEDWIDGNVRDVAEEAAAEAERLALELTAEQEARVADALRAAADARAMRDTIRDLARQAAEQGYEDFESRKELRDQLNAEVGRYAAHFDQRIIVAADDLAAVSQRVTELSTENERLNSKILLVETSFTDQTSALAQTIASLAVGTNTQFDHVAIWYFDTTTDGWTGYPLPPTVVAGGWLRPANNGEYVQSPAVEVDGDKYQQVRARIRRVGAPAWKGEFWWTGNLTPDHVEPEPGWGDDLASISIDMPWSGNIASLRMNLATNTATDYIEIDWVAIGRPTPGASSAEVQSLRRAFIDADTALGQRIDGVVAEMVTDDELAATTEAVDALTSRVELTETGLEAVSESITALETEVGGKASSEALDQLTTKVEELDDGSSVTQAQSIRVLRSTLRNVSLEALQGVNQAFIDMRKTVDVAAEASNSLGSRVDLTDEGLTAVAQDVTLLKTEVPTLAKTTALNALRIRTTVTEAGIEAAAERITRLEVDLPGKATVTALNALTLRVSDAEGTLTTVVADVAQLKIDVPKKANVTALNALTVRVNDAEGDISAMADSLLALETNVGRYSASGRFRVTVEATPSGALSRIGLKAAASSGEGDTRSAAMYLEAVSGGTSRALFVADFFAIAAGPTSTRVYPFYVTDGVVYIDTAHIRDLTVERFHIKNGAITVLNDAFTAAVVNAGSNRPTVQTLNMSKGRSDPLPLWYAVRPNPGDVPWDWCEVIVQLLRNGTVIDSTSYEFRRSASATERTMTMPFVDSWTGTGSVTYTMKATVACWKASGGGEQVDWVTGYGTVSNRFIGAFNAYK